MKTLPAQLGFRMPAEWEKRQRTFMAWPVRSEIWPDGLEEARNGYASLAKTIAAFEEVVMVARPDCAAEAAKLCGDSVTILPMEHDDSWMRDSGPTFLINQSGELAAVNWRFNAWGQKYKPFDKDEALAVNLLDLYGIRRFDAPLVLEGGSIHVDSQGTLLTTAECLLHPNRNPNLNRQQIETLLKDYLAIETVIWLGQGLDGDETDGHVDNVACFVRPGVILIQVCSDPNDPNYRRSQDNMAILSRATDARGRKVTVVSVEQPPARYLNGRRLTMSYLNYYPVQGGIIVPVFGGDAEATDQAAVDTLEKLYPDRKILPVDGMPIIKGGGNVHCVTQQMP